MEGAGTVTLNDIKVSAMSGKSQSDTSLFSLLSSDGLTLLFFNLEINVSQSTLWMRPRLVVGRCSWEINTPEFTCVFDELCLLKGPILSVCVCFKGFKASRQN